MEKIMIKNERRKLFSKIAFSIVVPLIISLFITNYQLTSTFTKWKYKETYNRKIDLIEKKIETMTQLTEVITDIEYKLINSQTESYKDHVLSLLTDSEKDTLKYIDELFKSREKNISILSIDNKFKIYVLILLCTSQIIQFSKRCQT